MIANDDGSTGTRTGDGFHNSLLESLPGVFPRHLAKKNMYVFSVVKYDGFFYRIFCFRNSKNVIGPSENPKP